MIRCFDIILSFLGLFLSAPILVVLTIVGFFDTGSPIFSQVRLGKNQQLFSLVKFRTMKCGTASVASHLVNTSAITTYGAFLRRTKLDELPQLWNVLKGEMSLVGPRPGLPSQQTLIDEREKLGVYFAKPGITGLAQVSCVDMSTPKKLAELDAEMLESLSLSSYFKFILLTLLGNGAGDGATKE